MMKYGLRVLVGLIAFAIGMSAFFVWFLYQPQCDCFDYRCEKPLISETDSVKSGNIEVRFIGVGQDFNRPTLRFKVTNNTPFVVENFRTGSKKFNSKEIEELWNSLCVFQRGDTLKSNESLVEEIIVDKKMFAFMKKKGKFEFGFYFSIDPYHGEVWSEPITISEEMKREIIENAPEFLKEK